MDLKERKVSLQSDVYWPDRFEAVRDDIFEELADPPLACYHVGSTAIPDIPGKAALDVIVLFADETAMEAAAESFVATGEYERPEEGTVVIRWHDEWAVFLKLYTPGDDRVAGQLAFREYLLDHPRERRRYAEIKRSAADEHADDLEAYTQAKGEFVAEILDDARQAGYFDALPEPH